MALAATHRNRTLVRCVTIPTNCHWSILSHPPPNESPNKLETVKCMSSLRRFPGSKIQRAEDFEPSRYRSSEWNLFGPTCRSFSSQPELRLDISDSSTIEIGAFDNVHGKDSMRTDGSVHLVVDFEYILHDLQQVRMAYESSDEPLILEDEMFCQASVSKFENALESLVQLSNMEKLDLRVQEQARALLSADNVGVAIQILSKCRFHPKELSKKIRQWEKYLGRLNMTPLTDELSRTMLMANGLSGNVGRVLSLLQLRKAREYAPSEEEFRNAVLSLRAASKSQHVDGIRNIFLHDSNQPAVDNPTRWLDAILINMSERNFSLTTPLANSMIGCYAATGGRTGKAVHHFYRVIRQGVLNMVPEERPKNTDDMPKGWMYVPERGMKVYQPIKVKVLFHKDSPPFYKVPASAKGKLLNAGRKLKLEREVEPEYSAPLAAAFAFANSLQHGACGHDPIVLDVGSYNALIKACTRRGALWRAMHVLDTTMPEAGVVPDVKSYNLVLSGLATVGDVTTAQEYYLKMHNSGIKPDSFTVSAIVDGLLNMNDIHGAITVVQDFFNQHSVLPPLWTHNKILELALGQGLVYEAKRYVYFIQQLWKWQPNRYHDEQFIQVMQSTQQNPSLQREALTKIFSYFGEELKESDFLP